MSSEIDFMLTEQPLKLTLKQELCEGLFRLVSLFYMVYGVFVAYIWTCKKLDAKSMNNPIVHYFWDPVIAIYSFGNISVLVMIGLSKLWSNNKEDKRTKQRHENHFIVCFIFIPLFMASCILNIIKLIRDIAIIPCHGYLTFLVPLSTLALIIGTIIIIFSVDHLSTFTKNWLKDLIKSHLTIFVIIGSVNSLVLTIALEHTNILRKESREKIFKFSDTCFNNISSPTASLINLRYKKIKKYLNSMYILFFVCSITFLVISLIKSQSSQDGKTCIVNSATSTSAQELPIISEESLKEKENDSIKKDKNEINASFRLPSASIVVCITFLSLSFLSFIVMYSLRQSFHNTSYPAIGNLTFCCFISVVYVIGSALSMVHIKEIKRWPITSNVQGKIIDKFLVWIGAGGQLGLSMTLIFNSVIILIVKDVDSTRRGLLFMIIFTSSLVILQTILQTIQVILLLEKKWIKPKINSLADSLCPAVGMMGLNMGLLLLSIDQLKSPILFEKSDILFVDVSAGELGCVSQTLAILQRLHASLLFASMIIYTHN